ncbi:hypothetical protein K435DRAFT_860391 [Dendrothele bispora CBS 962.96]|uniref:Uncharacterized protein n=1 Tax=Dendrothele bispora (strain CBS 962.96) TaxID=1314807 RepID=A0A4S8LY36_DENBC|nr:hypothetical protein K435DRAFT_860391 [Dendrothele bispora CBS 962.96]
MHIPLKGVNGASFTRITRSISKQDHPFLLLSDSFDLNQAIQRVVTFQLADIPVQAIKSSPAKAGPSNDVDLSPLSSPPSSRCQTPTPSSNGVAISSTQSSPLSSLPSSRCQSPISCDPVPSNQPHSDDSKSQVNTPGRKRRRRKRGSRDQTKKSTSHSRDLDELPRELLAPPTREYVSL